MWRVLTLLKDKKKIVFSLVFANFLFAGLVLIEPIIYWNTIDILVSFKTNISLTIYYLLPSIYIRIIIWLSIVIWKFFIKIISDKLIYIDYHSNIKKFFSHILNIRWSNFSFGHYYRKVFTRLIWGANEMKNNIRNSSQTFNY